MKRVIAAGTLALLSACSAAPIDAQLQTGTVPLFAYEDHLLAPVHVNGRLLELIVDSATPTTTLTPDAANRTGIVPDGETLWMGGVGIGMARQASVRSFAVGTVRIPLRRVNVEKFPFYWCDGLLGADVLNNSVIDLAHHELRLSP